MPYQQVYAQWRQADALLAGRKDLATAIDALVGAFEIATRLGAEPLRREVDATAHRATSGRSW